MNYAFLYWLVTHFIIHVLCYFQIIRHTVKADIPLETKRKEEETVFTEEDFKAFEEEYAED